MLSREFTWWCLEDFFKIFFTGESLTVFERGGLKGGVHYRILRENLKLKQSLTETILELKKIEDGW
jgi:hypothetical protein